jgi:SAM-dependent methyltransferase
MTAPPDETICLYCGSRELHPWLSGIRDRLGMAPGEWSYVRCADCGAGFVRPLPSPSELMTYYPPIYSFALATRRDGAVKQIASRLEYAFFYRPMYARDARRVVRATGGPETGKRLLDVGCGRGLRLRAFQRLGYEVHGWDVQPELADYVRRELGIPAVHGELAELERLFEPESFDIVTAYYVFEHVIDLEALVAQCRRLVKPGGWLVAGVPLADSLQAKLFGSRWSQATEAPRHVSLPTRPGLTALASRAGFADIAFVPDTLLSCAGSFALSVVPGSTTKAAYSGRSVRAFAARLLGAAVLLGVVPWCWLERTVFRRPALGLLAARKPVAADGP